MAIARAKHTHDKARQGSTGAPVILPGIEVMREGRIEPFLHLDPTLSSTAVRSYAPAAYRGGLPGNRLRRVLDYIGANLAEDLSLAELATVVGMSPHYFLELFRKSTGHTPHRYVLLQRIERAKQSLCDSHCKVIDAGLDAGFQNPSHFARMFRRFVGVSPSRFRVSYGRADDRYGGSERCQGKRPIQGHAQSRQSIRS